METPTPLTTDPETLVQRFAASLDAERTRMGEFVAAHRARLERAEASLEEQLEQLAKAIESQTTADADRSAGQSAPSSDPNQQDYPRLYEMALDDLRELKAKSEELQKHLARARSTAAALARQQHDRGTSLDWEAEKLRILAALESDAESGDSPQQKAERLKLEEVLETTDKIVAEKNSEIQELKRQLEISGGGANLSAEKVSAIAQTLDTNKIIQDERARLQQLQEQLRNKLCHAEIETSLERANLARQRSELEELMQRATSEASKSSAENDNAGRPVRGRWLSRLGLTDADRERSRKR